MYKYVNDISEISHNIIKEYVKNKNIAIDCTLGNGYDTDFLSNNFNKVYSFDIQEEACKKYKPSKNVKIINTSHEYLFQNIRETTIDCIVYNLGFLPGSSNKNITTKKESTIKSIMCGLELLNLGGIMSICVYVGHDEGKSEETCILNFLKTLPKDKFGVMEHRYINRSILAPRLFIVERNSI